MSNTISFSLGMDLLDEDNKPKRNKGRSLLLFPSDYTLIDLETTDLSPRFGEIIELGAIKVRDNRIVEKYSQLVKPRSPISSFITELTGITNEMVKDQPFIEDCLQEYLDFIGDDLVVGHNVNFDINFIYDNSVDCYDKEFTNDFVDTMRLSRRMFKEEKHHRLRDLIKRYNIPGNQEHRALSDCFFTYEILNWLNNYSKDNNLDLDELFRIKSRRSSNTKADFKSIVATVDEIDESNLFYKQVVVITGTLERMIRKDACQLIVNLGGIFEDSLTKRTNYLIVADTGYRDKTKKIEKAEKYKLDGLPIDIIPESLFYEIVDETLN